MRRTHSFVLAISAAKSIAVAALALPGALSAGNNNDPLSDLRRATSRYRSVDKATDAGYVQFFGCVHEPLAGYPDVLRAARVGVEVEPHRSARGLEPEGAVP